MNDSSHLTRMDADSFFEKFSDTEHVSDSIMVDFGSVCMVVSMVLYETLKGWASLGLNVRSILQDAINDIERQGLKKDLDMLDIQRLYSRPLEDLPKIQLVERVYDESITATKRFVPKSYKQPNNIHHDTKYRRHATRRRQ